jgi:hypothetical protein
MNFLNVSKPQLKQIKKDKYKLWDNVQNNQIQMKFWNHKKA